MQAPVPIQHTRSTKAQAPLSQPSIQTRISARAAKRMLGASVLFAVLFLFLAASITYLVDPLQFYHKPFGYEPLFSNEQRYQNPGLVLNYDYDTIVIGTSMTENFLPSDVDKALGGKTLKLSIRGSLSDEQFKTARLAIATGKVKQVLWDIDYFSLKSDEQASEKFPDYLYDNNRWNDYHYLLNYSLYQPFLKELAKKLSGSGTPSLEMLYNWNNAVMFEKRFVLNEYRKRQKEEAYYWLKEQPLETAKANFTANVLSLVKAHPEITFTFYYPPYSVLRQAVWAETNKLRYQNQLEMAVWMYKQFDALPNVQVYNFQTEGAWTYDLSLYKDLSHHNQAVNTLIAEAIGRKDSRYLMNAENAQAFSNTLAEQIGTLILTEQGQPVSVQVLAGKDKQSLKPFIFSSRVIPGEGDLLVPAKEAAAVLDASMDWNQAKKTIVMRHGANSVTLTIDQTKATIGKRSVKLDYAPQLIASKTHVPLLKMAALLGYTVTAEQPNTWNYRYTLLPQP